MKRIQLIIFFGLCIVTAILLVNYNKNKTQLKAARQALEEISVVDLYLDDKRKTYTSIYRSEREYFRGKNADLIEKYANGFSLSIANLAGFIPNQQETNEEEFFKDKIKIDTIVQAELSQAQRQFIQIVENYLNIESKKENDFIAKAKVTAEQRLREISAAVDKGPIGKDFTFQYSFILMDTCWTLPVVARKTTKGILGDERFNLIPTYLKRLEYNIESPEEQKIRSLLQEVKHAFSKEGFIVVHKSHYNLSSITPAQLTSLYKYLSYLECELNFSFLRESTGLPL